MSERSSPPYPLPGRPATDRDTRGLANCLQFAKFAWCAAEGEENAADFVQKGAATGDRHSNQPQKKGATETGPRSTERVSRGETPRDASSRRNARVYPSGCGCLWIGMRLVRVPAVGTAPMG